MNLLKAALIAGISYGLLRFLPRVLRNLRSPLRALHGPKSSSLLSGNMIDISKSVSPCIAWIEKYGRVIQIAGFLGVCIFSFFLINSTDKYGYSRKVD